MLYVGIGAGVGGFLLIVLSMIFIIFFIKRRRSTKSNSVNKDDTNTNNEIELSNPPLDITYGNAALANKKDPRYAHIGVHASYGSLDPLRESKTPDATKKVIPLPQVPKRPNILSGKKAWMIDWSELSVTSEIGEGGDSLILSCNF